MSLKIVNCLDCLNLLSTRVNIFNFPAKKLRKNTGAKIRMRQFFHFLSQPLLEIFIFPPKNLEKIRAPKIRMRQFFFLFSVSPLAENLFSRQKTIRAPKIRMRRFFYFSCVNIFYYYCVLLFLLFNRVLLHPLNKSKTQHSILLSVYFVDLK